MGETPELQESRRKRNSRIALLKREYEFCCERTKINYQTREVLTRFYILSISIIGTGLSLLSGLGKIGSGAQFLEQVLPKLFAIGFVIMVTFSLATIHRILALIRVNHEYKGRLNLIRKRLLAEIQEIKTLEPFNEYEYIFFTYMLEGKGQGKKKISDCTVCNVTKKFLDSDLAKSISNGDIILVLSIALILVFLILLFREYLCANIANPYLLYSLLGIGFMWYAFGIYHTYFYRGHVEKDRLDKVKEGKRALYL